MAVPMVSSAKGVTFGCFQRRVASFRVSGLALCDSTCFMTCQKSFRVAGAIWRNTFATFSEDALQFAWQAQHFQRVGLHVFCESYSQRCAKW